MAHGPLCYSGYFTGLRKGEQPSPPPWPQVHPLSPQKHFLAKLRLCSGVPLLDLRPNISGKKLCPVFHSCCRCGGCVSSGPCGSIPHVGLKAGPGKAGRSLESQKNERGSGITASSQLLPSVPTLAAAGNPERKKNLLTTSLKESTDPTSTCLLATSLAQLMFEEQPGTGFFRTCHLMRSHPTCSSQAWQTTWILPCPPSNQSPGPVSSALAPGTCPQGWSYSLLTGHLPWVSPGFCS